MKLLIIPFFLLVSVCTTAQNTNYILWERQAETDISLQPEYGHAEKTESQKADDAAFKKDILEYYKGDAKMASKKMSDLGFVYLYDKGDFITAMRRFNQAYMLNQNNADAYYGFGTIYFNLGAMGKAREQYDKGLKINPEHSKILTDYGTTYLGDYYESLENDSSDSSDFLIRANDYLEKSLEFDDSDSNTVYKLSIVKMYLGDCKQAKEFLKRAKKMNNQHVTESFEQELNATCK